MKTSGCISQFLFLIVVLVIVAFEFVGWQVLKTQIPAQVQPASTPVPMLVPNGLNPQGDNLNSETNLNNAQANDFNASAQEHLANATAVVANSMQGPLNAFKQGRDEGLGAGMGFGVLAFVIIGMIVFFGLVAARSSMQ